MTLGKLIETITELRGQQYDTELLTGWLNELEGQIVEEVINQAEGFDLKFVPLDYVTDSERMLAVPDRFRDVYVNYLLAKIDFANQETERYNNDVAMYNSVYDSYCAWFLREHRPKRKTYFSRF